MATNRFSRLAGILWGATPGAQGEPPRSEADLTRLEHCAYFLTHVRQSFVRNRCLIRASALSFSTLLALIPMLVVTISVTSSLFKSAGEDQIYRAINKFVASVIPPAEVSANPSVSTNLPPLITVAGPPNSRLGAPANWIVLTDTNLVAEKNVPAGTNAAATLLSDRDDARLESAQKQAAKYIHDFVQNTRTVTLGTIGTLLLLYVAFSMLANIEATFNDIWGVTRGRNWRWRILLYWATLTLAVPALAGAASLGGGAHLMAAHELIARTPFVGRLLFQLLPLGLLWLVFALIYLIVPNTKVRFTSALVGGLVAGSLWQLNNYLGYLYVSRLTTGNIIYGSLGLVPVFMAGLYLSWVIVLLGVQVSYAFQNRKFYLSDRFAENVNQRGREFIALRLMTCLGLRYSDGQPPASARQIAAELGLSTRLTQDILQTLLTGRLISEIAGPEAAYVPARPLDAINAHQVLLALRSINSPVVFARREPVRDEIYGEFARIEEAERVAAAAVTMQSLVQRARARLTAPARVLADTVKPVPVPAPVVTIELPAAAVVEPAAAPAPEPPARKIVVPEDNYDFPL